MTKEAYFDMMEMLGSEPIDSEIPVDFEDFPTEVQEAFYIYGRFQDNWDYMGGNYIGKNFSSISDILSFYNIEPKDRGYMYNLLCDIDAARAKVLRDSKPKSTK
jgi:hypothetical protein